MRRTHQTRNQQQQAMVDLCLGDDTVMLVRYTDKDGIIFKTSKSECRRLALRFNDHGWAINAQPGKNDKDARYIKVYYNKQIMLLDEAGIARHMS